MITHEVVLTVPIKLELLDVETRAVSPNFSGFKLVDRTLTYIFNAGTGSTEIRTALYVLDVHDAEALTSGEQEEADLDRDVLGAADKVAKLEARIARIEYWIARH